MSELYVEFLGKQMKNPLILASGVLGVTRKSLESVAEKGAGAVTAKSFSLEARKGHETPIITETECGLLNAVGYSNPGIDAGLQEFSGWKRNEPLIISLTAGNEKEFAQLAEKVDAMKQKLNCTAIELALSCPHTPGFGLMAGQGDAAATERITRAVKEVTALPIIVKLSPSMPGEVQAAKVAEEAGAAAINMGNTLGPGMKINIERKRKMLAFGRGGLSGHAIKPIAIRCVYDIYDAVKIPIIGTGGMINGVDAIEMMMAGARYVGVGTAVYYKGLDAFRQIENEMNGWLDKNGYKNVNEILGVAHE